jgi:WD40 repeat protein
VDRGDLTVTCPRCRSSWDWKCGPTGRKKARLWRGLAVLALALILVGAGDWYGHYQKLDEARRREEKDLARWDDQLAGISRCLKAGDIEGADQALRLAEEALARVPPPDGQPAFRDRWVRLWEQARAQRRQLEQAWDQAGENELSHKAANLQLLRPEHVPADAAILRMQLPPGSTVRLDGQDINPQRRYTFRALTPHRMYRYAITVHFPQRGEIVRTLLVQGGDVICLALLSPAAERPELVLQFGHTSPVTSVVFSPDGRRVLTGSKDTTAMLWDTHTGQKLRTFQMHGAPVNAVAFSRDGKRVLTGSKDETAILWDTETGRTLRTFRGGAGGITSVASSAVSTKGVLTALDRNPFNYKTPAVVLWDPQTGHQLGTFEGPVSSVGFSADGQRMLTGSREGTVSLWDTQTGQHLRTFVTDARTGNVTSVAFSPDGQRVLAGMSWDATGPPAAILWDVHSGKPLSYFREGSSSVMSVAFSSDGMRVLTGFGDGTAILWDSLSGRQLCTFQGHTSSVRVVAFAPGRQRVLTGFGDGTAILWDRHSGQQLRLFRGHKGSLNSVAISPDGQRILTGFGDGTAILWDIETAQQLRSFRGHTGSVNSVAFSPDGQRVLTGSEDGTSRLWDVATGDELARLISLNGGRNWAVVTPEGLFDGSRDGRERVAFLLASHTLASISTEPD